MKYNPFLLLSSLCSTLALSADAPPQSNFKQGDVLPNGQYPAAYNAPSQVKLQNDAGKWLPDLYVDASFLYYFGQEDGLCLGTSAAVVPSGGGSVIAATAHSKSLFQDFEYKPGFKVGIGTRFNDWTMGGEYTWIRQTTHTHKSAPDPDLAGGLGVWVVGAWFGQATSTGQVLAATNINSKWHLAIDMADLALSRPFYEGPRVSIIPSFGVRAAWIRQKVTIGVEVPTELIAVQTSSTTYSHNLSHSWAVGPRAAMEVDWLLGMGFRLQGDVAASLLFTQYTLVKHKENAASVSVVPTSFAISETNYNCLRPIAELGLGLGWGSYFCNQRYHFDFAATYDFLFFWDQNMMRNLLDIALISGSSPGDLSLNGLTLTARFDF